ncbi:metalloregulator ArsR/SmtB family transcription factor [Patescibacteria group bacterium]|nr:metalloregulator ArsR/SmtB family transcription factor [Patescibacteria group bacterium]
MKYNYSVEAKFFRGLSDATRLSVLLTLIDGEKTVGEIVEKIQQSQSNVSNHLKCLSDCGLVKNRRDGKNIYYSLRDPKTKNLLSLSQEVISNVSADIAACLKYKG